jgi:adenylate cyclase
VRRHLPVTLAGLLALGVALTATLDQPVFLERLELTLLDWRFQVRGEQPPQAPVVIAAIDAHSIDVLGRWPWRRTVMAELIDRLSEAGVLAIALDIVFSEPEHNAETDALRAALASLPEGASPQTAALLDEAIAASDTDAILADAIRRSERTVAGFFFRTGAGEPTGVGVPLDEALELVRRARLKLERPGVNKDHILRCVEVEPNIAPVAAAAARLGFFSVRTDTDGVVRRSPLLTRCGDEVYVSLDLAIVELLVGQPAMMIGDAEGVQEVRVGDFVFPTDDTGSLLIDYRGGAKAFPHLSIADILDGTVNAEQLEGTVVVVGATEVGVRDIHANPFQAAYPGVEVHANVLENLIIEGTLRKPEGLLFWIERPALVLLGLLVIFVVPRLGSTLRGALFAAALLAAVTGGIVWAFVARSIWFELAPPALTDLRHLRTAGRGRGADAQSRQLPARRRTTRSHGAVQRYRRLHHDLRADRARARDRAPQRVPHAHDEDRLRQRWHPRQVHRRRGDGLLGRTPRSARASAARRGDRPRHAGGDRPAGPGAPGRGGPRRPARAHRRPLRRGGRGQHG